MTIRISRNLRREWTFRPEALLESKSKACGEPIFKFSYHPPSGEFICATAYTPHWVMIKNHGRREFDEYIRGIWFREKSIVYLRGHENLQWLKRTEKMLRKHGVLKKVKIMWGEKAARLLEDDLKGL